MLGTGFPILRSVERARLSPRHPSSNFG